MYGQYIKGSNGEAPEGNKKYTRYYFKEDLPPVDFFWSVAMYNPKDEILKGDYSLPTIQIFNNFGIHQPFY